MHGRHRRPHSETLKCIPRTQLALREDIPWILYFARNLLKAGYLTQNLVEFALGRLGTADHLEFARSLETACARRGRRAELDADDWTPGDADSLAQEVCFAAGHGKLPLPSRACSPVGGPD